VTIVQDIRLEGRRLLTRHYYGDGRWGWRTRSHRERLVWRNWRLIKQRPKAVTWAKGTGGLARKTHAIRYSLTATHTSGETIYLTVWQCGQTAHTRIVPQSHPSIVCAACLVRLNGATEVVLSSPEVGAT